MATNYWAAINVPMTKAHYAAGGHYRAVEWNMNEAGRIVGRRVGKKLTLRQALQRRGDIAIIFGGRRARG
jgi:hypothetical protein